MTDTIQVDLYDVIRVPRKATLPRVCPQCNADLFEDGDLRVTFESRAEYFQVLDPKKRKLEDADLNDHNVTDHPVLYQCGTCMTVILKGRDEEHTEWPLTAKEG